MEEIHLTETLPALPDISGNSNELLSDITQALGVPRSVIAGDEAIEHVWSQLPRQITKIRPELRHQGMVRMCVAVASGLFDAGINYVWNAAILELREKVRTFGLNVIPQILDDRDFDEEKLLSLRDSDLLSLCLKLNIIGEENYFFLDQCRATRNNFSAAHPAAGDVDEDEFISFLSRCTKHVLSQPSGTRGIDTRLLLQTLKDGERFQREQTKEWARRMGETFEAQRGLILIMLHGLYSDPESDERTRLNALDIVKSSVDQASSKSVAALIDRHQEYIAKGDKRRKAASRQFFEKSGLLGELDSAEQHHIFSSASKALIDVHNSYDNFHNEPPFAQRLAELAKNAAVPDSARQVFVEAVALCGIGNQYGVSRAAQPWIAEIIKSFSPKEVREFFKLVSGDNLVAHRVKHHPKCKSKLKRLARLIDPETVPKTFKAKHASLTSV